MKWALLILLAQDEFDGGLLADVAVADGRVAAASVRGIRVWDHATGNLIWSRNTPARGVAISGDRLATVVSLHLVMFDVKTGEAIARRRVGALAGYHPSIQFSDDRERVAIMGNLGMQVLDARRLTVLVDVWARASAGAISPDSGWTAAGRINRGGDYAVELLSPHSTFSLSGHDDEIRRIAFSRDGLKIATADKNTIRLWDCRTASERKTFRVATSVLAFSPDGLTLACETGLVNVESGERTPLGFQATQSVCFSPDGRWLALGDHHGRIRIVKIR
jgi:WD40 repeat protein